ncbi:MAG: RloB family protein [Robiginitomaculum sp.]|nr:RloB family protein [Robiginitomaculum sp.]
MAKGRRNKKRTKSAKPLLVVLCEDSAGTIEYLKTCFPKRRLDKVAVQVVGCGADPKKLLKDARRALYGTLLSVSKADYVCLVFDQDQHAHFADTIRRCQTLPKIETFISIPCFEYFFILHYENSRQACNSFDNIRTKLRSQVGFQNYDKKKNCVPLLELKGRQASALNNSVSVRDACRRDGATGPLTEIDLLFDAIAIAKYNGIERLIATKADREAKRL